MKRLFALVIALAMLLSFTALAEEAARNTYYYVAPGQGQAYCYDMHLGFKWAAEQFGCEIIAQGADDWNSETTCQMLETVVSQKPAGIITVAWDAAMNPGILKAQEAGIPIILVEAESGELGDLYIGLDNVDAGRETAEQLIKYGGEEGKLLVIGNWGSTNIDDEGNPTTRLVLIENGILKNYMVDRLNGRRMGLPSTGSGRRQDYTFAPTSRLRNTYIAAGMDDEAEIISSCPDGLYAKQMGGGSVNPVTGEFNFAVSEGYLIRNGKVDRPVRGAMLIGRGAEVLKKIDRVGRTMWMAQGMCGASSGSIPTNVGQPMIRVTGITVGGR